MGKKSYYESVSIPTSVDLFPNMAYIVSCLFGWDPL